MTYLLQKVLSLSYASQIFVNISFIHLCAVMIMMGCNLEYQRVHQSPTLLNEFWIVKPKLFNGTWKFIAVTVNFQHWNKKCIIFVYPFQDNLHSCSPHVFVTSLHAHITPSPLIWPISSHTSHVQSAFDPRNVLISLEQQLIALQTYRYILSSLTASNSFNHHLKSQNRHLTWVFLRFDW